MNYSINKTEISGTSFLFLLAILLITACKKDEPIPDPDPEPETYEYYVSHELVKTYSVATIKDLFTSLELFYPEVSTLTAMVEYDVEVYNVTYKTMFQGEEIEASGLVCFPITEANSFPILSFQNGTNTSHANAPTKDLNNYLFNYLHTTSSLGYITLLPDYIGFGVSEQFVHPYLHKESTVLSIENLIEATGEMTTANLIETDWNSNVYLMGYSQGGWATLSTHNDIVNKTNLTYNVQASVCGAGPYDLSVVQSYMLEGITYPQPIYMAYSVISYNALGLITNPLTEYFNEPYVSPLPSYFNGQFTNDEINQKLNDTVAVLLTDSFIVGIDTDIKYEELRNAMSSNSVHGWATMQPIRLYHGTVDNYVPISTSQQVFQEFEDAGASDNVSLIPLEGLSHSTAAVPVILDALLWFADMETSTKAYANYKKPYLKIDH